MFSGRLDGDWPGAGELAIRTSSDPIQGWNLIGGRCSVDQRGSGGRGRGAGPSRKRKACRADPEIGRTPAWSRSPTATSKPDGVGVGAAVGSAGGRAPVGGLGAVPEVVEDLAADPGGGGRRLASHLDRGGRGVEQGRVDRPTGLGRDRRAIRRARAVDPAWPGDQEPQGGGRRRGDPGPPRQPPGRSASRASGHRLQEPGPRPGRGRRGRSHRQDRPPEGPISARGRPAWPARGRMRLDPTIQLGRVAGPGVEHFVPEAFPLHAAHPSTPRGEPPTAGFNTGHPGVTGLRRAGLGLGGARS